AHAHIIDLGSISQRHGHQVSRFSPRAQGRNSEVVSHLSLTHRDWRLDSLTELPDLLAARNDSPPEA
ncbi:MAG: hypothetical protein ACRDPT_10960, partial [Streptomycetales bacterium]